MNGFLQRLDRAIADRDLFRRGREILVAVSGGADSMVLLHALQSLAAGHRWKLSVAHFNHRLRGRASDADERLVQKAAAQLGLRFFSGAADVKALAERAKISVEMAARKLRHEFLARTAKEQTISTIALAHHADDQVELFFLRLLRGAGGEGLAGMKWMSPSPADPAVMLARPLLDFSKAELLEWAKKSRIPYRDDATNFSTDFLRNRIRRELLPLLRKRYQPGLDKTILRLMDIVGAEAALADSEATKYCRNRTGRRFEALPLAVQRRVLGRELLAAGMAVDFELVEKLRQTAGRKVSVCAGLTVARDAAGRVHCHAEVNSGFNDAWLQLPLAGKQGRGEFGPRMFRWRIEPMKTFRLPPKPSARRAGGGTEWFDADKIGGEIVLRHWRPGDRFQPIGLKSAAKLQDLFVNAKIPGLRRRELVLATTNTGELFWVEGLRIGERFKLTAKTRRKLVWRW